VIVEKCDFSLVAVRIEASVVLPLHREDRVANSLVAGRRKLGELVGFATKRPYDLSRSAVNQVERASVACGKQKVASLGLKAANISIFYIRHISCADAWSRILNTYLLNTIQMEPIISVSNAH
jgi:hypothetical protein